MNEFKVGDRVTVYLDLAEKRVTGTIKEINCYSWSPTKYWIEFDLTPPLWLDFAYKDGKWIRY